MDWRLYVEEKIYKIADALSEGNVVPIETAHVSGVSFLTIGEYGAEFLEHLASMGARVSVLTTSNPSAVDVAGMLDVEDRVAEGQVRILKALLKLGVSPLLSCTPYEVVLTRPRTFHAWAESSAAAYINTFRDAWSDKNPGPLALLAGIAGFTPRTEMYTAEGRRPTARVVVDVRSVDTYIAGVVGAIVGESLGSGVPYIEGLKLPDEASRREFVASLSTYSSTVFAVIEGVTPNWKEYRAGADFKERLVISREDVERYLSASGDPDAIYLGCPFADAESIAEVLRRVASRGRARRPIYVSTSPATYRALGDAVERARHYNVHIIAGTCLVVSPYTRRFRVIATDSVKAMYYIPRLHGVKALPCTRERCIELAYA